MSRRRLTSAWKLLVSWVIAAVEWWRERAEDMWRTPSPCKSILGGAGREPTACRRQHSTVYSTTEPSIAFAHVPANEAVALFGRRPSAGGLKHTRIGIDTPSPTAIASPLRSAGRKFIRP